MATTIVINHDDNVVSVHVTDSTGRDQTATVKRYPSPESKGYVRFVDALDSFMYEHDDERVCSHNDPACGPGECGLLSLIEEG